MTSLTDTHQSDARDSSPKKPPLDTTKSWKRFWLDTWRFEIFAWAFSVACFIAICTLLKVYENKVRPQLAYNVSFNAIISVLATACKSGLLLVIGEAVCQLKWLHFCGPRQQRLSSMQDFDNASRGPLGSLNILIAHRAQSLVCLGAAVLVLLLAFEPFVQQVISYPVLPVVLADGEATTKQLHGPLVSSATLINSTLAEIVQQYWSLGDYFAEAWAQGLWSSPVSSDGFEVAPVCSSGNCTWEEFTSAGICSQCSDMTASARLDCNLPSLNLSSFNITCRINITDGAAYPFSVTNQLLDDEVMLTVQNSIFWRTYDTLNGYVGVGNISLTPHATTFGGMRSPIAAYGYAKLNLPEPTNSSVLVDSNIISIRKLTVCGLGDCLRNYNVSTSNGQASIHTGNPEFGMRYNKRPGNFTKTGGTSSFVPTQEDFTTCWIPDNKSKGGFAYCVPWLNSSLPLISEGDFGFVPASESQTLLYPRHNGVGEWVTEIDSFIDRIDNLGFEKIMSNVAASLTKLQLVYTKETFSGTAHSSEVFVEVKWEWMILPGLLVLTGSLFFIATMVVNRKSRMPLWKSSALASFYHGLEEQEDGSLSTVISMEAQAEESKVRLMGSDGYGRLVLRRKSLRFSNPGDAPDPDHAS
ncbi:hypothetical protein N7466_003548 [Penicillium verhagenii]|uniref:uncharacterized protein n=1 Tax=Penicillium verhagenii TaxID=1562060 RepID=UPI002544E1E8|nr:uncharacterized protein N7466_003548 [Penicillium verhagenii]KAJ5937098.1 hypothetical protein N7466_003548 [Penicillium verhagenii]